MKPNGGDGSGPGLHPEFLYLPGGDRVVLFPANLVAQAEKTPLRRGHTSSDALAFSLDCLDDATPMDLIQHPHNPTRTLFAMKTAEGIQFSDRVVYHGQVVFAPPRGDGYLMHTTLPSGVQSCGTSNDMATDTGEFVSDIVPISHNAKLAIECFVLLSWVYKFLPICPTMILEGPPELGEALADVLRLVCRRPLVVGYAATAGLLRACAHFRPTLLIQGSGLRRDIVRILGMGSRPHTVALQGDAASSPFGPRLITCSTLPGDSHLLRNAIVVKLPSDGWVDMVKLSSAEVLNRAEILQQRLLGFELERSKSLRPLSGECPVGFLPKQWHLLRCFLAPIADDPELLAEMQAAAKRSWISSQGGPSIAQKAVIAAVFSLVQESWDFTVGDVAKRANILLETLGRSWLEARKVGDILRNELEIDVDTRTNRGYTVLADIVTLARVHKLVKQLDLLKACKMIGPWNPAECSSCRKEGLASPAELEEWKEDWKREAAATEVRTRAARAEFAEMIKQTEEQGPGPSDIAEGPDDGTTEGKS